MANRQHVSNTSADSNGPIFIQIQEGDQSTKELLTGGLMFDIAAEQNATLLTFDLRFFHRNLITESVKLFVRRPQTNEGIITSLLARSLQFCFH